jgi:hypothetical protein
MENIYQRMLKITADISTVAKNLEVGFGSSKYKAVGEADILRAVKPIEEQYGVYSYPVEREVIESGTMERDTKNGKSVQLYLRIKTVYRFICIDDPSSYIDIVSYGDGVDTQDKAPGKAMTYSDKYALMKAYKIQTGDDPDQYASEPQGSIRVSARPAQNSRKMMEDFIIANYDLENLEKIKAYYKVQTISDLTNEQMMAVYAQKVAAQKGM